MGGISWKDREMSRFPTTATRQLIRDTGHDVIISESGLATSTQEILLWGMCREQPRIVVLRTDNLKVCHWVESGKIKTDTTCKILQRSLAWCVEKGVGVIPRYVRFGHKQSADGLTRWTDEECDQWGIEQCLEQRKIPSGWTNWESEG